MEIFILLSLLLLFIFWVLNLDKEDENVGNRSNFPKYKLDKKQSEENSKRYKIWKEVQESKFVKSNTPDPYYESEEYLFQNN